MPRAIANIENICRDTQPPTANEREAGASPRLARTASSWKGSPSACQV
jgi:hypothetical protein